MALPESLFDVNFNPSQVSWQHSTLFLESKRMQYLQQLFRRANWMNEDWHKGYCSSKGTFLFLPTLHVLEFCTKAGILFFFFFLTLSISNFKTLPLAIRYYRPGSMNFNMFYSLRACSSSSELRKFPILERNKSGVFNLESSVLKTGDQSKQQL